MIKVNCFKCGGELRLLGGLLFSPPDNSGYVEKFHICKECYPEVKGDKKNG